ncbi:MAG TPA: hypothetical protein VFH27_13450, partial [Longimicrobiaceae bacterium]|nr:hypothetical protein [Longimicrobiaceae bacterium]
MTHSIASLRSRRGALLGALAALLLLPASARGNMAAPWHPGQPVGEPVAGLEGIRVVRERLTIDLRPLAAGEAVHVEAVYCMRNDGPARTVPVVFVADGLVARGAGVWMDGRPLTATRGDGDTLPTAWRAPAKTPGLDGGSLDYVTRGEGTLRFALPFAAGEHTVRVVYRARLSQHSGSDSPVAAWQLGYVLAPARAWAGFGGIDVHVLLPAGWRAEAAPALTRRGDELRGSWNALPADALSITARAPEPPVAAYWAGLVLLAAVGLALCLVAGRSLGAALARRGRATGWAVAPASALALVWAVATGIGAASLSSLISDGLGPQRAWTYGYGTGIMALLSIPLL